MNSRIKELADEANGPNNFFGALKGQMMLAGNVAVEKFAELIVKECMNICEKQRLKILNNPDDPIWTDHLTECQINMDATFLRS